MLRHRLRLLWLGACLFLFTLLALSLWPGEPTVSAGFDETSGSLGAPVAPASGPTSFASYLQPRPTS
jgi:hypothetical protein